MGRTFEEHLVERGRAPRATTRRWIADHDRVGLVGEKALAEYFGIEQDLRNKPYGDGGVDLRLKLRVMTGPPEWFEVDVKASPYHNARLLVPIAKCKPQKIYILAHDNSGRGSLVGWQWGKRVAKFPAVFFAGNDAEVYVVPQAELRDMAELGERCVGVGLWGQEWA